MCMWTCTAWCMVGCMAGCMAWCMAWCMARRHPSPTEPSPRKELRCFILSIKPKHSLNDRQRRFPP